MKKEAVFNLLQKMLSFGEDDKTSILIKLKDGVNLFTTIGWLKLDYEDISSVEEMPELFNVAEDEESPMYYFDYDQILFIRW